MSAIALDQELALLIRKEVEGGELPLTLRRFCAHAGGGSAVSAMQRATSDLLERYTHGEHQSMARISAGRLCELCGVTLEGKPLRGAPTSAVYSAFHPGEKQKGHSGALVLDPQRPTIQLPAGIDLVRARVTVGHEIGHYLIHRRRTKIDSFTASLPSSPEEEALSEYAARLLLLPAPFRLTGSDTLNLVSGCLKVARGSEVTLHATAARLGDPDSPFVRAVKGVILWRLNPSVPMERPVPSRLTPQWHLCPDVFIPIKRCHASRQSLVSELGSLGDKTVAGSRVEPVNIGSFKGTYRVDAVAWGSLSRGTRLVLAAFILP